MRWSGQLVGVMQSNQGKSRKYKKEIGPEKGRNEERKGGAAFKDLSQLSLSLSLCFTH